MVLFEVAIVFIAYSLSLALKFAALTAFTGLGCHGGTEPSLLRLLWLGTLVRSQVILNRTVGRKRETSPNCVFVLLFCATAAL